MKIICWIVLILLGSAWSFGQDSFARGEELFMQNNPQEAVIFLESSIAQNPSNVTAYLYLGISYEQLGRVDEAIVVYRQVLDRAGHLTATVASNLGNAYFRSGFAAEAEAMFTRAISADRMYSSAWLGRANARIRKGTLQEAIADYEQYLLLEPRAPQRQSIERMTAFIRAEQAEAERRRLVAEEMARLDAERARAEAERLRLAAEEAARMEAERQRVEAERRQRLLEDVAASLQSAAGASQSLSTGAEDVEGYDGEFELE
ncbi:MAG: tetratricopeptide repeat protein [Treponema sp.]|nr:tetratricopeptide repeat protein [Treponema sp.]